MKDALVGFWSYDDVFSYVKFVIVYFSFEVDSES